MLLGSNLVLLPVQILGVLKDLKTAGQDPLAAGFRLKPVFEGLPPDTDKGAYNAIK